MLKMTLNFNRNGFVIQTAQSHKESFQREFSVGHFFLEPKKRVRNYATDHSAWSWKMTEVTTDTLEKS